MVIIKFHQVLIENDLQLDINAKLDLESQNKIRNEFLDSIMCRQVVHTVHDLRPTGCYVKFAHN